MSLGRVFPHPEDDLTSADLSGRDLSGRVLDGAVLRGASLRNARLVRTSLVGADLRGADLRGANLTWADLSRANLSGARLSGAILVRADLRGADLSEADLIDAQYPDADFSDCELTGARTGRSSPGQTDGFRCPVCGFWYEPSLEWKPPGGSNWSGEWRSHCGHCDLRALLMCNADMLFGERCCYELAYVVTQYSADLRPDLPAGWADDFAEQLHADLMRILGSVFHVVEGKTKEWPSVWPFAADGATALVEFRRLLAERIQALENPFVPGSVGGEAWEKARLHERNAAGRM